MVEYGRKTGIILSIRVERNTALIRTIKGNSVKDAKWTLKLET